MSSGHDASRLPAEARARLLIDQQLRQAGWAVQDKKAMNLFEARGVAIREVTLKPGHGRADYVLYVDQSAVGVIEAKPEGTPLSGVEWQSATYADGLPADVRLAALTTDGRLPFVFEASGTETHFTNGFDPDPRARRVFHFPKPATLGGILKRKEDERPTWRGKVRALPPLDEKPLRPAQITAIEGIETSLAQQRYDRSLVQMATGAGKTYTAVTLSYRLLKHGGFNRILFLVDRNNLAKQTMAEYENYQTPDDGRKLTELEAATGARAAWLVRFAEVNGYDLSRSYAYADSHSDLPMLSTVGNPVAVSPDISLMRAAQRNQWSIVEWKTKAPTPRWHLPA